MSLVCRKAAVAVAELASSLTVTGEHDGDGGALAALLQLRAPARPLWPPQPPLDYLSAAKGFREAYGRTGCPHSRSAPTTRG